MTTDAAKIVTEDLKKISKVPKTNDHPIAKSANLHLLLSYRINN
jgi:hypothetical protein